VFGSQPVLTIESFLLEQLAAATRGRRPNEVLAVHLTLQLVRKLLLRRNQDEAFEVNDEETDETKMVQGLLQSNVHIWAHVMSNFQQQVWQQHSTVQSSTA